jgi:hypothetical protein
VRVVRSEGEWWGVRESGEEWGRVVRSEGEWWGVRERGEEWGRDDERRGRERGFRTFFTHVQLFGSALICEKSE